MSKILRDLKDGELSLKDMSTLREADSAVVQSTKTGGDLRDYSLQHTVSVGWGHGTSRALLPFELKIDDRDYTLSWAELRDLDRVGFFRRETDYRYYKLKLYDGPKITLDTDLNDEAQRDMIVRLVANGAEVLLDWYQFLRYTRHI